MKKFLIFFPVFLSVFNFSNAQWTILSSGTSQVLHDIHFINADTGIVAGDNQTLLITLDGGLTWNPVNNLPSGNIHSVRMISPDSIIATTYNSTAQSGTVNFTSNGGLTWQLLLTDNATGHQLDLEKPSDKFFITGNALLSNNSFGTSWDTLVENTSATTMLDHIRFADESTGHLSGLVSGIVSYSAAFYRTEDEGLTWFSGNPFSFPNSDALTTMCFIDPDTAIVFTNDYAGFSPSNINGVIKIYNFNKFSAFPGDTVFNFTSSILTASSPAYMMDAYFANRDSGFAVSSNGKIYKTLNGGMNWTADYNGSVPLNSVSPFGYAAGDNGVILKLATSTGLTDHDISSQFIIYPNPVNDKLMVMTHSDLIPVSAEIIDSKGAIIQRINDPGNRFQFDVKNLSAGNYFLSVKTSEGKTAVINWVKQ